MFKYLPHATSTKLKPNIVKPHISYRTNDPALRLIIQLETQWHVLKPLFTFWKVSDRKTVLKIWNAFYYFLPLVWNRGERAVPGQTIFQGETNLGSPCSIRALEQTIWASVKTIAESLVLINNLINLPVAYKGNIVLLRNSTQLIYCCCDSHIR